MFRITFALLALATFGLTARAQDPGAPSLAGKVEGKTYVSPTGVFKVTIPVLPELGGEITDTPNVVTFQDAFNVHISIAAFPQDATQRWENSTRGAKDYLIYFFSNFVLADFKQAFEGVQIESAKFIPGTLDGSLITYILIPGGTMFANKVPALGNDGRVPIAKRGNLLFVKNGHIFVISVELAERVIEGRTYKKTTAEEDDILRQRLNDVIAKMQFAKPATPTPAPAAGAAK
eukprot:TRINITY_DN33733_c0_g1_i1.p1 TRINITY_DN33733_c0_g1~~TRINITY_DN33733_c0_g1_i1.p1  ORF type:complete len:233 (+),score=53.86 TRINITY_DN33733_c0_g1_i1:129-827(+)